MLEERLKHSGWQLLMVALFVFALYSNILVAIRNYRINQQVSKVQTQVNSLSVRSQKLALLLNYYKSASYQDVQARSQLQLKRPAETTLIVQGVKVPTKTLSDQLDQQIQEQVAGQVEPTSNFSRWQQFLFD